MADWIIDSDHTVAAFAVRHFMITYVLGQFNKINGTIRFNPPDLSSISVDISIDASEMTTGVEKRDAHLKSADFLEVARFPEMTFKSRSIELIGVNGFKVYGDFTIRGVSKPVVLDAEYLGPINSPWGETCIGVRATTAINREDYGMTWNEKMENNGFVVGREVHVTIYAEADLSKD